MSYIEDYIQHVNNDVLRLEKIATEYRSIIDLIQLPLTNDNETQLIDMRTKLRQIIPPHDMEMDDSCPTYPNIDSALKRKKAAYDDLDTVFTKIMHILYENYNLDVDLP